MTDSTKTMEQMPDAPQKKKLGTGAKWAIGCGGGCLTMIVIVVALIIAGTVFVQKIITKYETELKGLGFETVIAGQLVTVTEPITSPQLFKGQVVRILTDADTDVAVLAQTCEINGTIQGKLYFRGQMLTINPGSKVLGGIDIQAQILQNRGEVSGEITGKYQSASTPAPIEE
jgi:hypothetical protein